MHKSMSLKYEPAPEPLHISVKLLLDMQRTEQSSLLHSISAGLQRSSLTQVPSPYSCRCA